MPIAARVMGGGFSAGQARALAGGVAATVSAAGTTQGTATALVASKNLVSTVAASSGVRLPLVEIGDDVLIYNGGANALTVYPPTSGRINVASANTGISLATETAILITRMSSTRWVAILSA